ncbi:MAG: hypothetical protein AAGC53_09280 [Actinomycetota bacterium]
MAESVIQLPPLAGGQADSWAALVELAPTLRDNWLLVGGQMVFLHEVERRSTDIRPTDDIDVVVNLRAEPAGLARIHETLVGADFSQDPPSPDGAAHRYRRGGAVFDVLAPDNVGERAQLTLGAGRTIEAPGTTQAFRRCDLVTVDLDGLSGVIRRPNLVGALVGKASAVVKISSQSAASRAKHLRDFDSLARLLGPTDRAAANLGKAEERLLRRLVAEPGLSELGAASLRSMLSGEAP